MRLIMVLLGLTVMLFTPLIRKVEAATELAHTLDAISCLDHGDHEIPDSGLDDEDDHDEGAVRSRGRRDGSDLKSFVDPRTVRDALCSVVAGPACRNPSAPSYRLTPAFWLLGDARQRQAWLQLFLF